MRKIFALVALFTLSSSANGHGSGRHLHRRQAVTTATSAPSVGAGASTATVNPSASGTITSAVAASTGPLNNVLTSTPSPGASDIPPILQITSGMPTSATLPVDTTYSPGATPPISGAPPLPSWTFSQSQWPPSDRIPDTTSPQVQGWLKELEGWDIPDLNVTDGTCGGSPAATADAMNRGWWTCGGYTRSTDIVACPDKFTWGMSFDDGPSFHSNRLLKYLDQKQLKATFFTVGSRCIEFPTILRKEYMDGHEISVHTWSHPHLTSLTNEQIVAELGWTRYAIQAILGVTPVTMRPPYGDIDDRVRAISLAMGMQPIIWTRDKNNNQFDTNDWKVPGGLVTGEQSYQSFQYILGNTTQIDTGFIVLEHDLYAQTVDLAVGYTLDSALAFQPQLTLEPIGKCMGWPSTNLYLETTVNTTFPYTNETAVQALATKTSAARAAAASKAGNGGKTGKTSDAERVKAGMMTWTTFMTAVFVLGGSLLVA